MSGNAIEWLHGAGNTYVARGGSYYHDRKTANLANRSVFPPDLADTTLGVRVCATPRPAIY